MAASVGNRQYFALHPPLNGFVPTFEDHLVLDSNSSSSDDENESHEWQTLIQNTKSTADSWIPRNASLVRLTGNHPLNSDPLLNRLMDHGFITPVPLHYVRNHGPVPQARWADWTVEVCGLVKRPACFSMDQLITEFPSREFPVTPVCAANRRKEQNMVKQGIGFNRAKYS